MAADLWHRRSDYPYSAEEVEEEALVRVPGRHGLVWRVGVLLVLVSGEDPRRTRWWDYTGYFLNLNGRICAEGLLTFGLGGLAIVYLLAPALDNLLSRIDTRKLTVVAVVLLAFYCVDQAYSAQHPNIGAGITDYKGSATSQVS